MKEDIKIGSKEEALSNISNIEIQQIECKCGQITRFHQYSQGLICVRCGYNLEYKN